MDNLSENASARGFSRYTASPSAMFKDVIPSQVASPINRRLNRFSEFRQFEERFNNPFFDSLPNGNPAREGRLVDMFLPVRNSQISVPAKFRPPMIIRTDPPQAVQTEEEPAGRSRSNSVSHYDENSDDNSPLGKKRFTKGLKSLSVTVRDIVNERPSTTYKEVADIILKDSISQDHLATVSKSAMAKEEQNIKRRVYDALNVLISAGVLLKEGKKVRKNDETQKLQINFKRTEINTLSSKIVILSEEAQTEDRREEPSS